MAFHTPLHLTLDDDIEYRALLDLSLLEKHLAIMPFAQLQAATGTLLHRGCAQELEEFCVPEQVKEQLHLLFRTVDTFRTQRTLNRLCRPRSDL